MINRFTTLILGIAAAASANFVAPGTMAQEAEEVAVQGPNIAYLEENKVKEGVIERPSGLQIRILRVAEGDLVPPGGTAVVNYEGRLIDGTVFDSSYERGQPARFPVDGVIKGWSEALMLMQVGAMWELVIPADIAYGDQGAPSGGIPSGATLIFKVELLGVM